jgi:hypothetical protein
MKGSRTSSPLAVGSYPDSLQQRQITGVANTYDIHAELLLLVLLL